MQGRRYVLTTSLPQNLTIIFTATAVAAAAAAIVATTPIAAAPIATPSKKGKKARMPPVATALCCVKPPVAAVALKVDDGNSKSSDEAATDSEVPAAATAAAAPTASPSKKGKKATLPPVITALHCVEPPVATVACKFDNDNDSKLTDMSATDSEVDKPALPLPPAPMKCSKRKLPVSWAADESEGYSTSCDSMLLTVKIINKPSMSQLMHSHAVVLLPGTAPVPPAKKCKGSVSLGVIPFLALT